MRYLEYQGVPQSKRKLYRGRGGKRQVQALPKGFFIRRCPWSGYYYAKGPRGKRHKSTHKIARVMKWNLHSRSLKSLGYRFISESSTQCTRSFRSFAKECKEWKAKNARENAESIATLSSPTTMHTTVHITSRLHNQATTIRRIKITAKREGASVKNQKRKAEPNAKEKPDTKKNRLRTDGKTKTDRDSNTIPGMRYKAYKALPTPTPLSKKSKRKSKRPVGGVKITRYQGLREPIVKGGCAQKITYAGQAVGRNRRKVKLWKIERLHSGCRQQNKGKGISAEDYEHKTTTKRPPTSLPTSLLKGLLKEKNAVAQVKPLPTYTAVNSPRPNRPKFLWFRLLHHIPTRYDQPCVIISMAGGMTGGIRKKKRQLKVVVGANAIPPEN